MPSILCHFLAGSGALLRSRGSSAMMLPLVVSFVALTMVALVGQCYPPAVGNDLSRTEVAQGSSEYLSPNRTFWMEPNTTTLGRFLYARDEVSAPLQVQSRIRLLSFVLFTLAGFAGIVLMLPHQGGSGNASMRLPPRWEPGSHTSFRSWMQDLMLWTIVTDMTPPQQCAAIIAQLGGAARELARSLTPAEVYNGGVVNGIQLDPVSFLLHGLQARFAPLDEETRLRAAQDLLSFSRRQGETVDTVISRFELTRQRARAEGGGAVSIETGALLLLRACGVSAEQFQVLTQPFGLRLPTTEPEFAAMTHHLRRMGHIVERYPNNIASGLRATSGPVNQTYMAEAGTGSSSGEHVSDWPMPEAGLGSWRSVPDSADWAFAAYEAEDASDTASATSSDHEDAFPVEDLQGMTAQQVDEYLFGQYQHAKRRWRRYTGKPVRALRRVLRRKGKGKGTHKGVRPSFLNIGELLSQSSYFRSKGKGGKSSGKGFGRRMNPTGRDGEVMKCSICSSSYHLRARCPQRQGAQPSSSSNAPNASRAAAPANPEPSNVQATSGLHFAAFESDGSWAQIMTPRSVASSFQHVEAARMQGAQAQAQAHTTQGAQAQAQAHTTQGAQAQAQAHTTQGAQAQPHAQSMHSEQVRGQVPEVEGQGVPIETQAAVEHPMTPDPWTVDPDPWMQWHIAQGHQEASGSFTAPSVNQASQASQWVIPGIGNVGVGVSFSELVPPLTQPPPLPSHLTQASVSEHAPSDWFNALQSSMTSVRNAQAEMQGAHHVSPSVSRGPRTVASIFATQSGALSTASVMQGPQVSGAPSVPSFPQGIALSADYGPGAGVPSNTQLGMISQVQMLRTLHNQGRHSHQHVEQASVNHAQAPGTDAPSRIYTGRATACTICLEEFSPNDDMCRLSCGHTFHTVCIGEAALHGATSDEVGALQLTCPNCRAEARVVRAWRYPSIQVDASPDLHEPAPSTSECPGEGDTQVTPVYHSNVRLPDGRVGLLIDPGSYGNLVGEHWLSEAAAQMNKVPTMLKRPRPLQVGGVGSGAQVCSSDCSLPIALLRQDGSPATGSFNSPVVQASGCPALLGLRALQQNNAILDMRTKQLHFASSGEVVMMLPPGSETFQLEAAPSGHLLLPCSAVEHVAPGAVTGEHHLFTDNASSSQHLPDLAIFSQPDASQPLSVYHMTQYELAFAAEVEESSKHVLKTYSDESARDFLVQVAQALCKHRRSSDHSRFEDHNGYSCCFGMYVHGGVVGITKRTQAMPIFTSLLCKMLRRSGLKEPFSSVSFNYNVKAPLHLDAYNEGRSHLLPVAMPAKGGGLWLEITPGTTVTQEIHIRQDGTTLRAGQVLPLQEGQLLSFSPKARHATQSWQGGDRLILAAYVSGSQHKLTPGNQSELEKLGFRLPKNDPQYLVEDECRAQGQESLEPCEHSHVSPTNESLPQSACEGLASEPASASTPCVKQAASASPAYVSSRARAQNAACSAMGVIKRVLLISLFHSTVVAFAQMGWEPMRVRPAELLRDSFDDIIYRLKQNEFQAVWVDLTDQRQFGGQARYSSIMARLSVVVSWAERQSTPCCLAAVRPSAWKTDAVEQLMHRHHFHVSYHNWCQFNLKLCPQVAASAIKHKVASTVPISSHECRCQPQTTHVNDLNLPIEQGSARARSAAESAALIRVIAALEVSLHSNAPEPAKPSDQICMLASSSEVTGRIAEALCTGPPAVAHQPYAVVSQAQAIRPATPISPNSVGASVDPVPLHAFPTDQKLRAKEHKAKAKAAGQTIKVNTRTKAVEQHHDDCGESLASIAPHDTHLLVVSSSDEEDCASESVLQWMSPLLNSFSVWSFEGSESKGPPGLGPASVLAADIEEMFTILASKDHRPWGVELVELCGGAGTSSYLAIKRRLRSGHNFDLVTGVDLCSAEVQRKVIGYLDIAKPLVILMGPRCDPFGPLGQRNRILHPDAWNEAVTTASTLASFCGEIALYQSRKKRYFLVEQPFPSKLFEIAPWPQVRNQASTVRVVFDQCQVGQQIEGLPVRKRTELVANSSLLLQPFSGLRCDGSHEHATLLGGRAHLAQVWTYNMCSRLVHGIERLLRHLCNQGDPEIHACLPPQLQQAMLVKQHARTAYPSVSSGTGDSGEVQVSEAWRRCKGCLWRLHKHDPLHSRVPGECKRPNVENADFKCPACVARKNRSDPAHTFGPDCRHVLTQQRKSGVQRRPYGRVPARTESTAALKTPPLTEAERRAADFEHPPAPPEPSSSSNDPLQEERAELQPPSDASAEASAAAPDVARRRGPDLGPRERRTWSEGAAQHEDPTDWTSFDVQTSLRALRHGTEAERRKILRRLHIRWFHCSADRMLRLLRTAGLPAEICNLIPSINDTCRVCQHWAKPSTETKTSSRMIIGFNIEVEGDVMFVRHKGVQNAILVLVDRGVRWSATGILTSRQTTELLTGIDRIWTSIFGPMQVLIFDGETGLDDDESTAYFQLRGITKRTSAPKQHTRIADRKIAVLRDTIHKLSTQLAEEGMAVPFERILHEATFALNALTSVNGCSPYVAVLGRTPALLPADDIVMSDSLPDEVSRHTHRLREVAVQAIAEGSARERMHRAMRAQTKPAGEELDYKVGQQVDFWREPASKDSSGWRGPATITDLTRLVHGRIGIRTSSDQMITCRVQDLRPTLAFLTEELLAFFNPDIESPVASRAGQAQQTIQQFVDNLKPGSVLTMGHVRSADGHWHETPATAMHQHAFQAAMYVAEVVFNLSSVAAVRCANGVRSLTAREEFVNSMTLLWQLQGSRQIDFFHSDSCRLSVVAVSGQDWPGVRLIQYMCVPDQEDWVASARWSNSLPVPDSEEPTSGNRQDTPSARLSTIPEGSEPQSGEAQSDVSLSALCEMFGDTLPQDRIADLTEAYKAIVSEDAAPRPVCPTLADMKAFMASDVNVDAEVPDWHEASVPEECNWFTEEQFQAAYQACSVDTFDHDVLDVDEHGVFVAIEAYGDACKLLEGLERLPNGDEHAEIRVYETHTRKTVIDRNDDLLTQEEIKRHSKEVTEAIVRELKTWDGFNCFARRARAQAPCVIDVRWVFKWKIIKNVRTIRARLCLRGFKETGADNQANYAATASRFAQRLLVSEGVLRGWVIASADVPKAFLQGVSYDELSNETGQPLRDVSFELTGEALRCLQAMPKFSGFDPRREVLHCLKPGTGCRDAPKCFSIKLRKVTAAFGLRSCSVDAELEFLFDDSSRLQMAIVKHVDDLKMIGEKGIIQQFVDHMSATFGPMDIEWGSFTFCGVKHTQQSDGSITLDQMKFLSACKPITQPRALAG